MKVSSQRLANLIGRHALEKKASEIKVLDLRKLSDITDFFVICTAEVELHARAVADHIIESLKKRGIKPWHNEGYQNSRWILLDYVDVVVHIFLEETREFYGLEGLWGDAEVKTIDEKSRIRNKTTDLR